MLRWRLVSAVVIIGLLLVLVMLDYRNVFGVPPGTWLVPLLIAIVLMGTRELLNLFAAKNLTPARFPVYIGAILVALTASWPVLAQLIGRPALADRQPMLVSLALAIGECDG